MKIALWVAALVVSGTATPWHRRTPSQCSSYCKESRKIRFEPGSVYVYDYSADSTTSLNGVADSESHIKLSAKIELEAESECELILRVKDVSLFESESGDLARSTNSEEFAQSLEKYPLRVSYQDGIVESICAPSEEAWVLNIKRGILSAMQNSMTDSSDTETVLETDVTGFCETNYTKVSSSTIRKTKNLQGCSGRHAFQHTNLKAVPYNTMSSVQSLPLVKSDYTCNQVIREDIIQAAQCTEVHIFRPFSSENSGAGTKITQKLTYRTREYPKTPFPDVKLTRSSLIFDSASNSVVRTGKDRSVSELLKNLVKNSEEGLSHDVPGIFGMLIDELKRTSYVEMSKIYLNLQDKKARKFLTDALPSVGTAASFGMLRDLVREKVLTETEEKIWLSSLAFQTRPTIEMVTAVAPLLKDANPSKNALLGISSLIHHYCASVDCNESDEIKSAIRVIEQRIGSACRALDDDSKEAILVALKSLGNAGIVVGSAAALKRCYQEENPMEIRLAAIAAARRVDCEFDRSSLMSLFRDVSADSELRIAAYLAVVKCPSQKIIEEIKEALQSEPVNQVGSFVWTHLTNLQESSDPNKLAVKELLESEFFKNKFSTDIRKFSRNIEFSTFSEELNLGGTVESNIIFSTQSYLPRSAMLNLTIDLFGESVNLLEVGGRVEGLEPLVEQIFGPDGYIPDETVENVLKSLRGKREVDTGALNQVLHAFNGKYGAEPEGSVFMKVFGNEILFSRMKGFCAEPDCNLFTKFNMGSTLDAITAFLREPNVDYTKSFQFLDIASSVPTAIGLPLTLSSNGTSTVSLKMAGKVSIKNWKLFDINGYVKPSAVVEVNSMMSVAAGATTSGVKVQNRLRTATSVDGKLQIDGSKVVSLKISTPKEKMEIFEVKSDVFVVSKGKSRKPKVDVTTKKMCSSDVLGTSLCGEVEHPRTNAAFPLVPSKASLYVDKTDKHTGYQFEYKWIDEIVRKQTIRTILVTFDMPESRYDRRLATKLVIDEPGRALRFSFHTPATKIDATGKYVFTEQMKSTDLIIHVGGEEFATLKAALRSDAKLNSGRFEPSLILTSRGAEILNLLGSVNYVVDTKYGLDLTVTKLTQKPIRITGDLLQDNGKYEVSAAVRSYLVDSSFKGTVKLADNNFSSKLSIDYAIKEGAREKIDLVGKWSTLTKGSLQKHNLNWNLKTSQYPIANSEIVWELQTSPNYVENEGRVTIAGQKWELHQLYSKQTAGSQKDLKILLEMKCEQRDIDYHASYIHTDADRIFLHRMTLRLSPKQEYSTLLELVDEELKKSVQIKGSLPSTSAYFTTEVVATSSNIWEVDSAFKWGQQDETKLVAKINSLDTYTEIKKTIQADLTSPFFDPVKLAADFHTSQAKSTILAKFITGEDSYDITLGHSFDGEHHNVQCKINAPEMKAVIVKAVVTTKKYERGISVEIESVKLITFDAKYKNDEDEFLISSSLYWDKNTDMDKSVSFRLGKTAAKFDTALKYPGQEYLMSIAYNPSEITGNVSWSPNDKIALFLVHTVDGATHSLRGLLETPFYGYEKIIAGARYMMDKESFLCEVNGNWQATQATASISAVKAEEVTVATASWESNIKNFEKVATKFLLANSEDEKRVSLSASLNEKVTELRAALYNRGSFVYRGYKGEAKLLTPFADPLVIDFDYGRESGKIQAGIGANIADTNVIRVQLHGELSNLLTLGKVQLNSSIRGYEEMSLGFNLSSKNTDQVFVLEGNLNGKGAKAEATITRTQNKRTSAFKLATKVETPFTPKLTANLVYTIENGKTTSTGNLSLDGIEKAAFTLTGTFLSVTKFDLVSSANITGYTITSKLANDLNGSKISTGGEITLNGKTYKLFVDGNNQADRKSRTFYGKLKLSTPTLGDVSFHGEYAKKSNSISSMAKLTYDLSTHAFSQKLTVKDSSNFEGVLELESPQLSIKLRSQQAWNGRKFNHQTSLSNTDKTLRFATSGEVKREKGGIQSSGNGSVSTPWSEDIKLGFIHRQNDGELRPDITISYGKSKEVKISAVILNNSDSHSFSLNLAPNFCDPMLIAWNYDLRNQQKAASGMLEWQKGRRVELDFKGTLTPLTTDSRLTIKTPLEGIKNVGLTLNYDLVASEKKLNIIGNVDSVKAELKAKAGMTNSKIVADASLRTPIPGYDLIAANAVVDFSAKKAELTIKAANKEIKAAANYRMIGSKIIASLKYTNPFTETKSVSLDLNYDSSKDKKVQVTFQTDKTRSDLLAKLASSTNAADLEVTLSTPLKDFEQISLKAGYDLGKRTLLFNVKKNSAEISFQARNPSGVVEMTLSTPFEVASDISLTAKYSYSSLDVTLSHNSQKHTLIASYDIRKSSLDASGTIASPFFSSEKVIGSVKHDWSKPQRTVKLVLSKGGDKFDFDGTFNIQDLLAPSGSFTLRTSYESIPEIQIAMNYDVRTPDKSAEVKAVVASVIYRAAVRGSAQPRVGLGSVITQIPLFGLEDFQVEGSYDLTSSPASAKVSVIKQGVTFLNAEVEADLIHISAKALTPLKGYEDLRFSSSIKNGKHLEITVSASKNEAKVSVVVTSGDGVELKVETPFQNWKSLFFRTSYNFESEQKMLKFEAARNSERLELTTAGLVSLKKTDVTITFTSTIPQLESLSLAVQYDVRDSISGAILFESNGAKKVISGDVDLSPTAAKLHVSTPFKGYRDFVVSTRYEKQKVELTLEAEGRRSDFSAALSFDSAGAAATLRTPFTGFEELSATTRYDLMSEKKSLSISLIKNKQKVDIVGNLVLRPMYLSAESYFISTIPGFERLDFACKYEATSTNLQSSLLFGYDDERYEAALAAVDSGNSIEMKAVVSTPVRRWENVTVDGVILKVEKKAKFTMERNGEKHDVSGTLEYDSASFKATLETPFRGFETISVAAKYDDNSLEAGLHTTFRGFETLSISGDYDLVSDSKMARITLIKGVNTYENIIRARFTPVEGAISAQSSLPFLGYENSSFDFIYDFSLADGDSSLVLNAQRSMSRIESALTLNLRDKSADFSARFASPFRGYEEFEVTGKYDFDKVGKTVGLSFDMKGQPVYKLVGTFGITKEQSDIELTVFLAEDESSLKFKHSFGSAGFDFDASIGCDSLLFTASGHLAGIENGNLKFNSNIFATQVEATWRVTKSRIESGLNLGDTKAFKAVIDLVTKSLKDFSVMGNIQSIFFENQEFRVELNALKLDKSYLAVNYKNGDLSFNFDGRSAQVGDIWSIESTIRSPLPGFESIITRAQYGKGNAQAEMDYSGQKIELNVDFDLKKLKSNSQLRVTAPFMQTLEISYEYDVANREKSSQALFSYGETRFRINGVANVKSQSEAEARIELMSNTFVEYSSNIRYNFAQAVKTAFAEYKTNGVATSIEVAVSRENFKPSVSLNLVTPVPNYENIVISGNADFTDGASASFSAHGVKVEFSAKKNGINAALTSPFQGFRNLRLESDFSFTKPEKHLYITVSNEETLSLSVTSARNNFHAKLDVPYGHAKSIELSGVLPSEDKMRLELTLTVDGYTSSLTGNLSTDTEKGVKFNFTSPFTDSIELLMSYDFIPETKRGELLLRLPNNEIRVYISGQQQPLKAYFTVESRDFYPVIVEVEIDPRKAARVKAGFDGKRLEFQTTYTQSKEEDSLSASLSLPIEGLEDLSFVAVAKKDTMDVLINYAADKAIKFSGTSRIDSGFTVQGTLSTPFSAIRTLSGELYFELSEKAKGGRLSAQWNDESKFVISGLLKSEQLEFTLQTPFTKVKDFSMTLNYTYTSNSISASAQIQRSLFAIEGVLDESAVTAKVKINEKSFAIAARFETSQHSFNTILDISTSYKPFEKFKLELRGSKTTTEGSAHLYTEIPYISLPSLSLDANYTLTKDKFEVRLTTVSFNKTSDVSFVVDYADMAFSASSNIKFFRFPDGLRLSGNIQKTSEGRQRLEINLKGEDFEHAFSGEFFFTVKSMALSGLLRSSELEEPLGFNSKVVVNEKNGDISLEMLGNSIQVKYNVDGGAAQVDAEADLPVFGLPKTSFTTSLSYYQLQLSLTAQSSHKLLMEFIREGDNFSGSCELDTSLLGTTKKVRFTGSLPEGDYSSINIEMTVEGDAVHTISAGIDLTENIKFSGHSESPYTGQVDVKLSAGSLDGMVMIETQEATHKAKYQLIKSGSYEIQIDAESPYIADDRLSARGTLRRNSHIVEATLTTETGSGSHTLSCELRHEVDSLLFKLKAETSVLNLNVASLELRASRGRRCEAFFALDLYRSVHKISASLQKDPVQASVQAESPFIRDGMMAAVLNTRYNPGQQADGEIEFTYGKKSLRFDGAATYGSWKDLKLSANLTTPFESFKNGQFDSHFKVNSGLSAGVDVTTSLVIFPQAAILFKYEPTDSSYDASLIMKSPVAGYESAAVLLNFPVSSSSAEPRLTATFKDKQYSAYGVFRFDSDKIEVTTVAEGEGMKIGGSIVMKRADICEVRVEAFTPFEGYEKFSWELRGQMDIKNWADSKAYIDWEGKRIELTTSGRAENGAFSTKFELQTPFLGYEKFVATVRMEKTERKTLQVEFEYQGKRVGVNFDYFFNSLTDFIIKASVSTPLISFDKLNVELSNRISSNSYSGTIEGQIFDLGFGLNIEGDLRSNSAEGSIETRLNDYIIVLKGNSGVSDKSVDAKVMLNTPFQSVHSFDANLHLEKSLSNLNNVIAANLNGVSLFSAVVANKNGGKTIEVINPVYPISLTYTVEKVDNVNKLVADFCWDLNDKSSRVGIEATYTLGLQKKLVAKVILPTRTFNVNVSFENSGNTLENTLAVSWKDGESFGYSVLLKGEGTGRRLQSDSVLRLDFPQRSFELEYHTVTSRSEYALAADFKWDAARNPLKKMGFAIETADKSSWGATNKAYVVTLNHFKLPHDLILKFDYTIGAPTDILLASVSFQYSEAERELILAQLAVNEESDRAETSYKSLVSLRHLVSGIDLKAAGEIYSQTSKHGGSLVIDYIDIKGVQQSINVATKLDMKRKKLAVEAKAAEQSFALSGGLNKEENGYTATVQTSINKEAPAKIEAKIDVKRPFVKVHMHLGDKAIKAYAGLPTDKELKAKITHEFMGKTTLYGFFTLKLDSSKLLSNKVIWRPEALQEFRSAASGYITTFSQVASRTRSGISTFVSEVKSQEFIPLKNALTNIHSVYASAYEKELNLILNDFTDVIEEVNRMYKNDEFYIKSLVQLAIQVQSRFAQASVRAASNISCVFGAAGEGVKNAAVFVANAAFDVYNKAGTVLPLNFLRNVRQRLTEALYYSTTNFTAAVNDATKSVEVFVSSLKPAFEKYYGKLEEVVMREIEAVQERWISIVRGYVDAAYVYAEQFKHVYEWTKEKVDVLVALTEDAKAEVYRRIVTYPLVDKVLRLYKTYYAWLEEIHFQEYVELIAKEFTGVAQAGSERFEAATAAYRPYIKAAVHLIKGQYELAKQVPPVAYFSTLLDRLFLEVQKLYSLIEMKEQLNDSIRNALRRLDKAMNTLSEEMKGAAGDINYRNMIEFATNKGKFDATLRLPMEWNSLKELPKFETLPIYKRAHLTKNAILDYIDFSDHHFHFLDQYARFSPDVMVKNIFPPFGSHALIAGNQHYMTFDKKFFEFAGECSYLLVNDFADGNFSVLVNYEGSSGTFTKKSLTVISKRKQLEITSSKVVVDGKRVELPYQDEDLAVYLDGHRITLETARGGRVECNLHRDACTVHVTGWSFGKTVGLFGIYNYEPSDDFTTSNRELRNENEVDTFAHSWRIGTSRCRVKNVATIAKILDPVGEEICDSFFTDETSYLRPCFNLVDTTPYKKMCLNDLSALMNSAKRDLGACTAATAYAMECRLHGVDLWVPPICVRCELEDKNVLRTGESVGFNSTTAPAPKSADVVFLVEQKKCLKDSRIGTISQEIDYAMKEKGYLNNRYAVVTFGGKGVFEKPHVRTADSETWNNRKVVQKAFEGLEYDGVDTNDAIAAMKYATKLGFRAGVSKHLVLISCEAVCHASDYGDAATVLLENDFKLHVLRPEKFRLKGKQTSEDSKLISQIYGYDANDIYTIRSNRRFGTEKNLRQQLLVPKDFCTPLALETNGSIFDLSKIVGEKSIAPKRVVEVFAKRFALTAEAAPCQKCDCLGDKDGFGSMHCQRCISPAIDKFLRDWDAVVYESELENTSIEETEIRTKPDDPPRLPKGV